MWAGGGGNNAPKYNFLNVNLREILVARKGESAPTGPTGCSVSKLTNNPPPLPTKKKS